MIRGWPWETKRLAEHHWVTRPWRPFEDVRVLNGVWLVVAVAVLAAVWHLQGEAGLLVRKTVSTLVTLVLVWAWRVWRAGRSPT